MCADCREKKPSFGSERGKPVYCAKCARKRPNESLTDVISRRCADCREKQPKFGSERGKPVYCGKCARKRPDESLTDVVNRRCADCSGKKPNFGSERGKPVYCAECARKRPDESLTDVVSRRCADCREKKPNFGNERNKPVYCAECARKRPDESLTDVVNRRCADCREKQPNFGSERGKPLYCAECAHKRPNESLTDVVKKRCADCREKKPSFGSERGKPVYCAECARKRPSERLQNVTARRCATPYCPIIAQTKAYLGYCQRCFNNTYPDSPIVRNHKSKERTIADFVRESYPDYDIAFDRRIADGCSRRRPDMLLDMGDFVVVIEVDENQHSSYDCSCENKRLMELFQDAGNRPMAMIRFNPDQYYNAKNNSVASCWGTTDKTELNKVKPNKTAEWAARLATLKTTLDLVFSQGPTKEVDVYHLYYDGF